MHPVPAEKRCGWPGFIGIVGAILLPLIATITAIVLQDTLAMPGAVVALTGSIALGVLALSGRAWARWVLFGLVALTAMVTLLLLFFDFSGPQTRFAPMAEVLPVVIVALYILVGAGIAWPWRAVVPIRRTA